jgi:hypothetical protein
MTTTGTMASSGRFERPTAPPGSAAAAASDSTAAVRAVGAANAFW